MACPTLGAVQLLLCCHPCDPLIYFFISTDISYGYVIVEGVERESHRLWPKILICVVMDVCACLAGCELITRRVLNVIIMKLKHSLIENWEQKSNNSSKETE